MSLESLEVALAFLANCFSHNAALPDRPLCAGVIPDGLSIWPIGGQSPRKVANVITILTQDGWLAKAEQRGQYERILPALLMHIAQDARNQHPSSWNNGPERPLP